NIQEDIIQSIENFLAQSILDGCEGIMIKTLTTHSTYTPSKRSSNWIKIKKDYLQNISDTLDLVVIGAYYGKGKRTGNFGGFLLASYNDETDCYESVCKIGTGFDEQILSSISYKIRHGLTISSNIGGESDGGRGIEIEEKEIKEIEDRDREDNNNTIKEININDNTNKTNSIINNNNTNNITNNNTNNIALCISKPPPNYIYTHNTQPDIWITPTLVWEVKAAGFTLSPIYKSGQHSNKKGISLRFPRFIRERTDKKPEDSTTSSQIVSMYNLCNNTEENEDTDY
ncbi:DNA ligase, partial [Hamiltosporidium tvaerminnensis]